MRADEVEASWDAAKKVGCFEFGLARRSSAGIVMLQRNADDGVLKSLGQKTLQDEGFDFEPAELTIRR